MSDQYKMFGPATSGDTGSAISSRGSESGATPCASPDGQTTGKSGRGAAPASHSRTLAKKKRSTTRGIYGQSGFLSSAQDDLSYALASRLRPVTDSLGSTLFTLTWCTRITPQGHSICALRASARRNGDNVCIGWPTPRGREAGPDYAITGRPESGGLSTETAAALSAWTTPSATDGERAGSITERMSGSSLQQMVRMAAWATPKQRDHKHESGTALSPQRTAVHPPDLSKQAQMVHVTDSGEGPIGYLLGPRGWEIRPASGQLNPQHSRWLMGLPPVWDDCGVTAMQSLRPLRRPS